MSVCNRGTYAPMCLILFGTKFKSIFVAIPMAHLHDGVHEEYNNADRVQGHDDAHGAPHLGGRHHMPCTSHRRSHAWNRRRLKQKAKVISAEETEMCRDVP